jgi:hypothetical protein
MTEDSIQYQYEHGLLGYVPDKQADADYEHWLSSTNQYAHAHDAIGAFTLDGKGKGKVALPYLAAIDMYPNCLPGGRQMRGSCVAWSTRNALMVSFCSYLTYGENKERYTAPKISEEGCANGAFSTDAIYWFRRHGRDGWQCSSAAKVATEEAGLVVRKNYPEIDINLTTYSPDTEGRWGSRLPPQEVRDVVSQHLSGSSTVCKTWEDVRDIVASGYACSTCGMEAWQMGRDENGVAMRSRGSWAHAMAVTGVDDRPEIHQKYGCGLVLVQNSWGNVNKGGDRVYKTDKKIPPGSFWARWNDFSGRYIVALGPCKGWPAMKLPNWGAEGIL